jgi:elongation factor P--(R)-beta-lysine ligase
MLDWQPTARRLMLELRGALLAHARHFFADRGVLEVDTPIVVNAPVTDVHIHSARVQFADDPRPFFLHTSPEYAMKRLLAAGSGDIYQICHVVRGMERGSQHNAEFTLIEWYRIGYSLDRLMSEVDTLVRHLLGDVAFSIVSERLSYREAFLRELHLDPFTASLEELAAVAKTVGFAEQAGRDELLELLMGAVIGPRLGRNALTFIHDYPAGQAALARLNPQDPSTALRFELYCAGVELANGFEELASTDEQRARFQRDNEERQRLGLPTYAIDERLLAALEAGLPRCSGVALGFDRTLMLAAGARHIDEVLSFPIDRA